MDLRAAAVLAGSASTTLFVASYLPMLVRAIRTRDLRSYSRSSLVIANVGNAVQTCYVISLPVGPLWFLHAFYLVTSALMLGLHLRHGDGPDSVDAARARPASPLADDPPSDNADPSPSAETTGQQPPGATP